MHIKQTAVHNAPLRDVLDALGIADGSQARYLKSGLSSEDAKSRLAKYGLNTFKQAQHFYYAKLFWRQVKSPLVFILFIAGVIALTLGSATDAIVIFLAVFINTGVGMYQEGRASKALDVLRSSQKKYTTVLRDGGKHTVPSANVVPGDIIEFEIGDRIPADARLIGEKNLETNESALTGEWVPVDKDADVSELKDSTPITGQVGTVFMDTLVTSGFGRAVVTATGFDTEVGKIARFVSEPAEEKAPFKRSVRKLAHFLGIVTTAILLILLVLGLIRGAAFGEMLLISLAIAVSVVPEGLPVAVTVILALGMERILKAGGLVRSLTAAETLGSTTIIMTDKTGTITKADMQLAGIITLDDSDYKSVLQSAVLVSEAFVENPNDATGEWVVEGRPMDRAIIKSATEYGMKDADIRNEEPRTDFIPFESKRRYSASLHKRHNSGKARLYVMGSMELLIGRASYVLRSGKRVAITKAHREYFNGAHIDKTRNGLRDIAIAYRDIDGEEFDRTDDRVDKTVDKLTFAGIITFHDPVREDVPVAIAEARSAGVRPIMVTGDSLTTAKKIAKDVGILIEGRSVMTGEELSNIDEKELQELIPKVDVYARVLPAQKLMIARAAKARGDIVAMTGDGVNDAPALRYADIGLALGSGTEVAKESANMVLLNNSFSIIVVAIKEGRRIIDNLKKVVVHLFSTGFHEVVLVLATIAAGFPLPILPAQILWTNIVEEGIMTFAFAFEPAAKGIMKRGPRDSNNREIITAKMRRFIFVMTAITSAVLIVLYFFLTKLGRPIGEIRALMFFGVSIDSILFVFSIKDLTRPLWRINIFSNKYLVYAFFVNLTLLMSAFAVPQIRSLLSIPILSLYDMLTMLGIAIINLVAIEVSKYFIFYRRRRRVVKYR